jgi:chloramphenicol-sensitive protein RarD
VGTDVSRHGASDARAGVLYGFAAYGLWGLMPLYFDAVREVPPGELLAQRIAWCGLLLAGVLTLTRQWGDLLDRLRSPRVCATFLLTSLLLSVNWLVYIYGVTTRQIVETSLGYFINPLVNVLLGMIVFRERLRVGQGLAVLLAAAGVLLQVASAGRAPWIAVTVALSFGLYGLFRKQAPVDALLGLSIETFVMAPFALGFLAWLIGRGTLAFGHSGLTTDLLLLSSGVITAVPLLCFGQAARKLRLSTLGFLQYIAPTVQFVLAVVHLREQVTPERWRSFALIWAGLAVYSLDSWRHLTSERAVIVADGDGGAELEPINQIN